MTRQNKTKANATKYAIATASARVSFGFCGYDCVSLYLLPFTLCAGRHFAISYCRGLGRTPPGPGSCSWCLLNAKLLTKARKPSWGAGIKNNIEALTTLPVSLFYTLAQSVSGSIGV